MTPHNYEIVDCGVFCEVIFLCISPKNLLGDFFDSFSCNVVLPKILFHARVQIIIFKKIIFATFL